MRGVTSRRAGFPIGDDARTRRNIGDKKVDMQKRNVDSLRKYAKEVEERYSRPDRNKNHSGETFALESIIPLSESAAAVIYLKSSGKKAVAFFFLRWSPKNETNEWNYFFPSDGHILGFLEFPKIKAEIERENYIFNFDREPGIEG